MNTERYVAQSLELHLFFSRIMKEHSLFLKAGFTPAAPSFSARAEFFKREFEKLLSRAVSLSSGVVSNETLCSGELLTEFTVSAEKQTEHLTGIKIDRELTRRELSLINSRPENRICGRERQVKHLNQTALRLLDGLITFKEEILRKVLQCEIFTMNYPLLIEHIIREARLYREYLEILERDGCLDKNTMKNIESFWNQIMMEHAMFIRGLLDPSEADLFNSANSFVNDYAALLKAGRNAHDKTLCEESLKKTVKFRDFKAAGAKGIGQCRIRSIILPLLADHVLREANHYIRLLK